MSVPKRKSLQRMGRVKAAGEYATPLSVVAFFWLDITSLIQVIHIVFAVLLLDSSFCHGTVHVASFALSPCS
jgi:hypothetical protein